MNSISHSLFFTLLDQLKKNAGKATLLGIILTNRSLHYKSSGVFPLDFSDHHCPAACIRDMKLQRSKPRITVKRNFKRFSEHTSLFDVYYSDTGFSMAICDPHLAICYFIKHLIPLQTNMRLSRNHQKSMVLCGNY